MKIILTIYNKAIFHDFEQKLNDGGYQCETYSGALLGALPGTTSSSFREDRECIKPIVQKSSYCDYGFVTVLFPSIRLPSAEEVRERISQEKLNRCAARELAVM